MEKEEGEEMREMIVAVVVAMVEETIMVVQK